MKSIFHLHKTRLPKTLFLVVSLHGLAIDLIGSPAVAQHRSHIESANQRGDHFEALLTFDKIAKRKLTAESHLTAAKSAWALSLPDRAISEFESANISGQLSQEQTQQARLSTAIIHFQEGRPDEALMQSQKLLNDLNESSAFRARVLTLAAQSLIRMGSKAQAEEKLTQAFLEASYLERSDIAFQVGELQNQLGRWEEAKQYLRTINSEEDRAPEAIRLLISICLARKEYEEAQSWLDKAQSEFPEQFSDSWSYFAAGLLAAHRADAPKLEELLEQAHQKFAPSDSWLTLLEAEREAFLGTSIRARFSPVSNSNKENKS